MQFLKSAHRAYFRRYKIENYVNVMTVIVEVRSHKLRIETHGLFLQQAHLYGLPFYRIWAEITFFLILYSQSFHDY